MGGGDHAPGLAHGAARPRRAASTDHHRLAPPPSAGAARGGGWGRVPRRRGRAHRVAPRARLVSRRPLAVADRMPVAAHLARGIVRRANGAGRRRARVGDHRRPPRARPDAALLPSRAPLRAVQQVVRHRVLEARRCPRAHAAPRTPRPRPRVRGGRAPSQCARADRSRGTDAAPVLREAIPGDLRRALRGRVPREGAGPVAARPAPHRRDRPMVELDGRAVRTPRSPQRLRAAYDEG